MKGKDVVKAMKAHFLTNHSDLTAVPSDCRTDSEQET
jgi:hypothetical protein